MKTGLTETYEQILREKLPNLFRLYPNPFVAQTCFCLARYVQTTWELPAGNYQTFLANSRDEALSGAIKLARYDASMAGRPTAGLVIDLGDRLGPFATAAHAAGEKIEFVPGLVVVSNHDELQAAVAKQRYGFMVLLAPLDGVLQVYVDMLRHLIQHDSLRVIRCIDRLGLAELRNNPSANPTEPTPDIVVFDESFVNRDVPFGAFTATKALYDHWNRPGRTTFHSTTYQPNTISSLHFMRCLAKQDPEFHTSASSSCLIVSGE